MAKKVSKPRLVKDYDKLPKEVIAAIKAEYPNGFSHKLINYTTPKGEKVLALPYDAEDMAYLVRVTIMESKNIVRGEDEDDDDIDVVVKAPRQDLDLDGLDIDGLKQEDDTFGANDDEEEEDDEYKPRRGSRRNNDDDEGGDEDY